MRVAFCVLGFSTSGGAPAMICLARLAASTTYANWLSGAFVSTVISVFPPKRCQKFFHSILTPRFCTTQRCYDGLHFASCPFDIVIHYAKIVILSKLGDFIAGFRQAPGDFFVRILAPQAQSPLQLFARRRQNKNGQRLRKLFFHLRSALHVNL